MQNYFFKKRNDFNSRQQKEKKSSLACKEDFFFIQMVNKTNCCVIKLKQMMLSSCEMLMMSIGTVSLCAGATWWQRQSAAHNEHIQHSTADLFIEAILPSRG